MDSIAVRNTLDELIRTRGEDYASLSRLIGRNTTYIQQFIRRGVPRRLSEEDRRRLAEHFNVSEQLLGGPARRLSQIAVAAPEAAHISDDYVLVPYLDIGASAGPGALAEEERAESTLAFRARWVREMASGRLQALSVIRVQGDSMLPTLSDGDQILVDSDDAADRLRDGIYVLRVDGTLLVKRLAINPSTGRLTIKSDNPAYPVWSDCAPDAVSVIGRVVWVGRRLP